LDFALLTLFPHQRIGVEYLKSTASHALLFDEQRVGKTPQMIVASGELGLDEVLVITTVAGVGVWQHMWKQWDQWGRTPVIVPWSQIATGNRYAKVLAGHYKLLILDESHYAKNPGAARTQRAFGVSYGDKLMQARALAAKADRVWCATGTPMSHDPSDLFMTLKALFPQILEQNGHFPDVTSYGKFRQRYCVLAQRKVGRRFITVVVRGQNLDELQKRIKGRFIRRRQVDVGIRPAFWDTMPFVMSGMEAEELESLIDRDAMTRAMQKGDWAAAERHLAAIRRVTGAFKAHAVVRAAKEFFETYEGEKLVIAYWHQAVGTLLEEGLAKFNPVRVDGSVTGEQRTIQVKKFTQNPTSRVFLAQIAACGEAIDLSASAEMWFAESVFTPAQMAQMGARITNLNQPKQCLVRVVALADSIDELIQDRLVDLSRSIAHTLGEKYAENFRSN
jgi:SWI/SNF-related matrix-associated actin-dependent regulator 1 of chromatin subfamily A